MLLVVLWRIISKASFFYSLFVFLLSIFSIGHCLHVCSNGIPCLMSFRFSNVF